MQIREYNKEIMKNNILYILLLFCCLQACVDDKATTESTGSSAVTSNIPTEDDPSKTVYLRDPVNIVPSTGEDYPKTLKELNFPVMPNTEVTNVGNTDIENGTVVMQMETLNSIDDILAFYKKELPKQNWTEKELKIFNGADGALNFHSGEHTARILVINDRIQDFRKVAVTLNKKVNYEDLEKG